MEKKSSSLPIATAHSQSSLFSLSSEVRALSLSVLAGAVGQYSSSGSISSQSLDCKINEQSAMIQIIYIRDRGSELMQGKEALVR